MLELVLAALLTLSPQGGTDFTATVFTADGGRLRGTILDAGAAGVTVQLADGSTRKLEPAQVSRVDFADGTSWKPAAPAPAAPRVAAPAPASQPTAASSQSPPAPAPNGQQATAAIPPVAAVAAIPPAAASSQAAAPAAAAYRLPPLAIPLDKLDTVHLARGGRVRCLVVEEGADGIVVRLVDGAERRFAPGQAIRIDWADGTRSDLAVPPPAPAPAPAAPAAPAAPVPYQPLPRR